MSSLIIEAGLPSELSNVHRAPAPAMSHTLPPGGNMKILMVLTSHDPLGDGEGKAGFWVEDFAAPYHAFQEAGAQITLASPRGGQFPLDPGSDDPGSPTDAMLRCGADSGSQALLASAMKLDDLKAGTFDAVFYPGGHGPSRNEAENLSSIALIEAVIAAGKPVAAVRPASGVRRLPTSQSGVSLAGGG